MAEDQAATEDGAAGEEQAKPAPRKRTTRKKPAAKPAAGSRSRSRAPAAAAADTAENGATPEEKAPAPRSRVAFESRPKTRLEKLYADEIVATLKSEFGYTNPMETPYPTKIILNIGLGETIQAQGRQNLDVVQKAQDDLGTISGQRAVVTKARRSIANFKLREGMPVGVTVTLRGLKMWQFLDRLVNVALPRVRDFHGVSRTSFDGRGNYSLGLSEQIVFPEIDYNTIDRLRGLQVNIVTSARNDEEARRLLELLGMPFERVEDRVPAAV